MKHYQKLYDFVKNKKKAYSILREKGNRKYCYCVEGAMCEVYRQETGQGSWHEFRADGKTKYLFDLNGYKTNRAPQEVLDYFGIDDNFAFKNDTLKLGLVKLISKYKPTVKVGDTVSLNCYGFTYKVIVTRVETNGDIWGRYMGPNSNTYTQMIGLFQNPTKVTVL